MQLSVIVIFFNNRREAPRTLHTLSRTYQKDVESLDYEVLAIDSNSPEPLDAKIVESFGAEFSYHFVKTGQPSPVEAMRRGLELSKGEYVMMIIDGAHILTPGILCKWQDATKVYPASLVYTQRYHLGKYRQNDHKGYNQSAEDALLNSIDWKGNGYSLFKISNFRQADEWWFSQHFESNCFIIPRKKLIEHGSIYKDYFSIGGGFLNLEMFKKATEDPELTTIILIGESTFHQFHGGTTTNVAREEVKLILYKKEYFDLNKSHYGRPKKLDVHYFGNIEEVEQRLLMPTKIQTQHREIARDLMLENKIEEAIFFINRATELYPFSISLLTEKVKIYKKQGRYDEALSVLEEGLIINKLDGGLLILKGEIFLSQNNIEMAAELFKLCHTLDESDPIPLMKLSKIYLKKGKPIIANQYIKLAVERVEELKIQNKFLAVFTFVKNYNYRPLFQKMLGFSGEISTLAHNFGFILGKTEYLEQSPEKLKQTGKLIDLYYNSKVSVNQSSRLGNLLIWQNRKEELWNLCEHLEQRKLPYQSHFLKAKWHLNRDNYDACLNKINDALPHAPTIHAEANCYIIQAKCQLKQKQFKRALQNAHKAVEINPNNTDFLFTKAKTHLEAKQNQRAKVLFEHIVAISNYHFKFDALLHLFDIDFNEGNYENCKHHLEKANKVKPNHTRILKKQQKLAIV